MGFMLPSLCVDLLSKNDGPPSGLHSVDSRASIGPVMIASLLSLGSILGPLMVAKWIHTRTLNP